MILFFLSFDGDTKNGNAKFFHLSVQPVTFRQGLPKAMHFTLDGKGVFVYTLSSKQISLALSFSKAKDRKGSICFSSSPKIFATQIFFGSPVI